MFDLNKEVDAWCRDIIDCGCARTSVLNELRDHLYCLVEEQMNQGLTDRAAFVVAIKQMGDSDLISAEYARNASIMQKILAYDRKVQRSITSRFSGQQLIAFMLIYSLACAVVIVAGASWFNAGRELINWMLAIWLIPVLLVASNPEMRKGRVCILQASVKEGRLIRARM
jgi:type IV secretory pathway TrbD component